MGNRTDPAVLDVFRFWVSLLENCLFCYIFFLVLQMYRHILNVKMSNDSVVCLLGIPELETLLSTLRYDVHYAGSLLVRELKRRDTLTSRHEKQNDMITAFLQALSAKRSKY